MQIDPLQQVIAKNRLKLEQAGRPPRTPQVRELYSIDRADRSFLSAIPTRKTTIQTSLQHNNYSRLIEQSSPISVKHSLLGETQMHSNLSPFEFRSSRKECPEPENQVANSMHREITQLRREKEILQQQHLQSVSQLAREMELQKKNYQNVETALREQLQSYDAEIKRLREQNQKLQEIEATLQSVLLENNQLKQQKLDDQKFYKEIQDDFELFFGRTCETKSKLMDTKHYAFQIGQITQFLLNKQSPPLEFLVQMSKLQKQLRQELENVVLPQGCSLKMVLAQTLTVQVEIQVILNQMLKDLKNQVEKFTKQYISEVGMQLVSIL